MQNLLKAGFKGPIMPVNRNHRAIAGVLAYSRMAELPLIPSLGILCIPALSVPSALEDLALLGCKTVIVFDGTEAGKTKSDEANSLLNEIALLSQKHKIRILGPSSLGIIVPDNHLFASSLYEFPKAGRIAFISQSASVSSSVLDWARGKGIGFSHFISLGQAQDIDFGDILDYLDSDPSTQAILIYIENITRRRTFMSAARAVGRKKLILAVRAGDDQDPPQETLTHSNHLVTSDDVYSAAFSRAGILRVNELEDMFSAVEFLGRSRSVKGTGIAIISNGGNIAGLMDHDLAQRYNAIATLSSETCQILSEKLDRRWSQKNPINIMFDASLEHYRLAIETLLQAPEVQTLLVIHAPTSTPTPLDLAEIIITLHVLFPKKDLITCFLGDDRAEPARKRLRQEGIPSYETPTQALRSYMYLLQYRQNQEILMETPTVANVSAQADSTARKIIAEAMIKDRPFLTEQESRLLLTAYDIPFIDTEFAHNPREAGKIADKFGCDIVLKVVSPDISHKSDFGGVALNLKGAFEVEKTANRMIENLKKRTESLKIEGFTVQKMLIKPYAQEIFIGVTTDSIFGPVILFGKGGTSIDIVRDFSIGLPPLNTNLARIMINQTAVSRLLLGFRDHEGVDLNLLDQALVRVSQLIVDCPAIYSLDINPIFVDSEGIVAVDCKIQLKKPSDPSFRLAIPPYPKHLEEQCLLKNGQRVTIRPIRPEDEPNHHRFIATLTPEDIRFRFFGQMRSLPHREMAKMTQIDYDREMAFIAETQGLESPENTDKETLGVVRVISNEKSDESEFAIIIKSTLKGSGLGRILMNKVITYCRDCGKKSITGQILSDNHRMLAFVTELGFQRTGKIEDDVIEVSLSLDKVLP